MARLRDIGRIPSSEVERKQISQPILDVIDEYVKLIQENTKDAMIRGSKDVIHELDRAEKRVWKINVPFDFEEFSEVISEQLKAKTFDASKQTLDRLTGRVMDNLDESYRLGLGIDDAADRLGDVFHSMEDYELVRVARTEINQAQNKGAMATEQELGVEYHQWWSAGDSDVRDSHQDMHGQIVKVGDEFSNGMTRPGDTSGPIEEWINCRCRIVPFLLPEGLMVPSGLNYFYESDLVEMKVVDEVEESEQIRKDLADEYSRLEEKRLQLEAEEKSLSRLEDRTLIDRKLDEITEQYRDIDERLVKQREQLYVNSKGQKIPIDEERMLLGSAQQQKVVDDGVKEFSKFVDKTLLKKKNPVAFESVPSGRSYYRPETSTIGVGDNYTGTIVHELGHWVEHSNPKIHKVLKEFFEKRTKGESLVKLQDILPGYGPDEVTKVDRFIDAYMGKVYEGKGSSELLSMGLQTFYENPGMFAQKDPEMFRLIYKICRGQI